MKPFLFLAFAFYAFFSVAPLGADTTNGEFRITAFSYAEGSRQIDITFTSSPGGEYAIDASADLRDWSEAFASPIIGSAGSTTTVSGLPLSPPSRERLFFRVRQLGSFTELVTVGNPGNAADTATGFGPVAYEYRIGKYEVTNAQYAAFLNAVAAADPNALYNTQMGDDPRGGITRMGDPGSYSYAAKENMGDKPVNFVSWYDALRFCNWLHHDRPDGAQGPATTEGGAYTLTAPEAIMPGTDPTHGANGRNAGARSWLPSENEWYKAAYHDPGAGGSGYWLYPTRSNDTPTVATADEQGNIANDTGNIANYDGGASWNGQFGNVTTVGSGGPGSAGAYGAFDMGGNVMEWNEEQIFGGRGRRGGHWNFGGGGFLRSTDRLGVIGPALEPDNTGFRVAAP